MLITNGQITRDIAEKRFPQYEAKGYKKVEEKPKAEKGDKKPKE